MRVKMCFLAMAAGLIGSMGLSGLTATPAYADKSIQATLGNCSAGQVMVSATFTLSNVPAEQKITVSTLQTLPPSSPDTYNAATATATYTVALNAPISAAQATVPDDWQGRFSLTGRQCVAAKAPNVSPDISLCNSGPIVAAIKLRNNNPVWTRYTVSLAGQGAKTLELTAGESDQVDFQPLSRGTNYALSVAGSDGTATSGTVVVPACGGGIPVPPTKGAGQPTPSQTRPPSASPEAAAPPTETAAPSLEPTDIGTEAELEIGYPLPDEDSFKDTAMYWTLTRCCPVLVLLAIGAFIWWLRHRRATAHT